jgi:hypothetical protein
MEITPKGTNLNASGGDRSSYPPGTGAQAGPADLSRAAG